MTQCMRSAALTSGSDHLVFIGRAGSFSTKEMKRKIQVDLSFFQKGIPGQVKCYCTLCIIFGQYELGILYGNKKTGLRREKKYPGPKTSSCPA